MQTATLEVQIYLDEHITSNEAIVLSPDRMNYFGRGPECGKQGLQFDFTKVPKAQHGYVSRVQAMIGYNPLAKEWVLIDGGFVSQISDAVVPYVWRGRRHYLKHSKNGLNFRGVRISRHISLEDGTVFNFALIPGFAVLGIFRLQDEMISAPSDIEHGTFGDGDITAASMSPLSHIPSGVTFVTSAAQSAVSGPEFDSLSRSNTSWVRAAANVNNVVDDIGKSAKSWVIFFGLLFATAVLIVVIAIAASYVGPEGVGEWIEMIRGEG